VYLEKIGYQIDLEEFTINNKIDYIIAEIYKGKYDFVAFSTYIWNIGETLKICRGLKKVLPNLKIALGGPEVSYNPKEVLEENPAVDFVISGEGELAFAQFYKSLLEERDMAQVKGLSFRRDSDIIVNLEEDLIDDLDIIPFPYGDSLDGLEHRILYYESSRGCPFNCQYCLSSSFRGVRYFSLERVQKDMLFFLERQVKQVKFVDRTFNAKKAHYFEILKFLKAHDNGKTNFHFEITASLLDEEVLAFLETVREGLFQFEVGVQSTNEETITAIERQVEFSKISKHVKIISAFKNIHLHLDLIVGLPFESFDIFKQSFNNVYDLKPEKLQLGFLKLLKGSGLWFDREKYGYVFSGEPPYEIYSNKFISFDEVLLYKEVEELVESYYNSHRFDHAISYLIKRFFAGQAIDFYIDLYKYWQAAGLHHVSHKSDTLYKILLAYYRKKEFEAYDFFEDLLKFDFYKNHSKQIYGVFRQWEIDGFSNLCHEFLQVEDNVDRYVPNMRGKPAKYIIKKVKFEHFEYDVLHAIQSDYQAMIKTDNVIMFNYEIDNKVFSRSEYHKIKLEVSI